MTIKDNKQPSNDHAVKAEEEKMKEVILILTLLHSSYNVGSYDTLEPAFEILTMDLIHHNLLLNDSLLQTSEVPTFIALLTDHSWQEVIERVYNRSAVGYCPVMYEQFLVRKTLHFTFICLVGNRQFDSRMFLFVYCWLWFTWGPCISFHEP